MPVAPLLPRLRTYRIRQRNLHPSDCINALAGGVALTEFNCSGRIRHSIRQSTPLANWLLGIGKGQLEGCVVALEFSGSELITASIDAKTVGSPRANLG